MFIFESELFWVAYLSKNRHCTTALEGKAVLYFSNNSLNIQYKRTTKQSLCFECVVGVVAIHSALLAHCILHQQSFVLKFFCLMKFQITF